MSDNDKERRIQAMISDILDSISYEKLERKLKEFGDYHCVNWNNLKEIEGDTDEKGTD